MAALKRLCNALKQEDVTVRIVQLPTELNGDKNGEYDIVRHEIEDLEKLIGIAKDAFNGKKYV